MHTASTKASGKVVEARVDRPRSFSGERMHDRSGYGGGFKKNHSFSYDFRFPVEKCPGNEVAWI